MFIIVFGAEDYGTFTKNFVKHFLRGYRAENQIDEGWLKEIPPFLNLREIELYTVILRCFGVENIDHPWVAIFVKDRKNRIGNKVPFVDFDFSTLTT